MTIEKIIEIAFYISLGWGFLGMFIAQFLGTRIGRRAFPIAFTSVLAFSIIVYSLVSPVVANLLSLSEPAMAYSALSVPIIFLLVGSYASWMSLGYMKATGKKVPLFDVLHMGSNHDETR